MGNYGNCCGNGRSPMAQQAILGGNVNANPPVEDYIMWLRAEGLVSGETNDYGVVDGSGNVTQWTDLSGNGNHATYDGAIGTSPNLSGTNGGNSRKGITFDGVGDNLQIPKTLFNNKAGGTMFVICKTTSITAATENEIVFFSAGGSSNGRFNLSVDMVTGRYRTRNRRLDADVYLNSRQMLGQEALPSASTVLGLSMSWSTGLGLLYQDGEIINWDPDMVQTLGNTSNTDSDYASIGRLNDGTNYPFNGVISEVILFDRALSTTEMASMNTWLKSYYNISTPSNYAEDAIMTAYLARLAVLGYTEPSNTWYIKMNNFWAKQRANGNLALLDRFGGFQAEDTDQGQNFSLVDFITPSVSCELTASPTWDIRGFTGNGTTQLIDTNWIPSNGVNFTQNSGIVGAYGRKTAIHAGVLYGSRDATGNTKFYPRWTDGKIYGGINNALGTPALETNYSGFGIGYTKRTASNLQTVGINNDPLDNASNASVARSTVEMRLLANNNNGVNAEFYAGQISMWFAGSGSIDIDALIVDYKTFEAGIGILS